MNTAMPPGCELILVSILKGGCRKSTTAMLLAFGLAQRGDEVLLVDADAATQGVVDWASRVYAAGHELPFHVVQWTQSLGLLVPFVQAQARQTNARWVIVDVGGEAPEVVRQAVLIADRVLVPTGAEQAELGRVAPTAQLIRSAGKPMSILLNRVPAPGVGIAKTVREVLTADGYSVLKTEIPQNRELYAHVWGTIPAQLGAYEQLRDELVEVQ